MLLSIRGNKPRLNINNLKIITHGNLEIKILIIIILTAPICNLNIYLFKINNIINTTQVPKIV